jgi:hypothetical protein
MHAGNDFSTLYAPLIRDGRMEKYYWNPTREDRIGVCFGIFKDDQLDRSQIEYLVDTFPGQSIDFFGALRARVYDSAVREFIESKGLEGLGKGILVSARENFEFPAPSMDLVRPAFSFCTSLQTPRSNAQRSSQPPNCHLCCAGWRCGEVAIPRLGVPFCTAPFALLTMHAPSLWGIHPALSTSHCKCKHFPFTPQLASP